MHCSDQGRRQCWQLILFPEVFSSYLSFVSMISREETSRLWLQLQEGRLVSPSRNALTLNLHERRGVAGRLTSPRTLVVGSLNVRGCSSIESKRSEI